jgi:4-hydroxybenzoate polyprenyltransferase
MNVITAAVLVGYAAPQPGSWTVVALLVVALSVFYCGGMSLNDVCDYTWDKEHQNFRPIVAGKITLTQARVISAALFAIGFVLLALAPNVMGLAYGFLLFAVIYAYNYFHKAHASSVLLMAAARALVFVVAAQAIAGELNVWIYTAAGLQFAYTLLLTVVARHENTRGKPYSGPVIPRMIAGMALVDGLLLAILIAPLWLVLGAVMALLTRFGQRYVRGD